MVCQAVVITLAILALVAQLLVTIYLIRKRIRKRQMLELVINAAAADGDVTEPLINDAFTRAESSAVDL